MVKKAKITVYCCGLFFDSILSKSAGFSICRSNFSQGPYSNIIHTLVFLSISASALSRDNLIKDYTNALKTDETLMTNLPKRSGNKDNCSNYVSLEFDI